MVELVDTLDLGSSAERRVGSTPSIRTFFLTLYFIMEYIILIIVVNFINCNLLLFQLQKTKINETTSLFFEMNKQLRDDIEKMRKVLSLLVEKIEKKYKKS